jgi:gliding motility-associated-like protein
VKKTSSILKVAFALMVLLSFTASAQHTHHSGPIKFTENKKQWQDNILYQAELGGGAVFLEKNCFTFLFEDVDQVKKLLSYKFDTNRTKDQKPPENLIKYHAYKVEYLNSSEEVTTKAKNPSPEYYNYYLGNDASRWASKVNKFSSVTYTGLYKGIDMHVYESQIHLKTDYTIHSGADPGIIKMKYSGIDKIQIRKNNLVLETSINKVTELKPYAYQLIDGDTVVVSCEFVLEKNVLSFALPDSYNKNYDLVIDPVLIFSTYSGSTADNWGYTATYDYDGFVYAAGNVFGLGYPTTLGAFQTAYNGGNCDIAITKYDTTGSFLIYSTYLGGAGPEVPHSIFVNSNNELFVFGTTGSSNFPVTAGAYDNTFHGGTSYTLTYVLNYTNGSDMYVSRFKADGTALLASTYVGGYGNDGLNAVAPLRHNYADDVRGEILLDANNNCYVVSSTQSLNFPVSAGAFQTSYGGGAQDGCIIKLDNNLQNMIWSSYLGGSGSDAIYAISVDTLSNIYLCGGTTSTDFPVTAGSLHTSFMGGSCDGFITKVNTNGNSILKSTYYGSPAYDQTYLMELDKRNYVHVLGQTEAPGNTFIYNALWNMPNSGQFVSKINPDLNSLIWSTAFGTGSGIPNISPTAFLVDLCNNIYLSGWGGAVNGWGGTNGMPITPNAFQSTTDNSDYYFLVIKDDASALVYGTFFGGSSHEHVDGGTSRFDKFGKIYQSVCAGCGGSDDFPTTPGAWSNTNNSSNCNNGVIKFDFNLPITVADFDVPPVGCAPYNAYFHNTSYTTSGSGVTNFWTFGDGGNSSQVSPHHTYPQSGIYNVTLIVKDTGTCNGADTITKSIVVLMGENDTLPTKYICLGDFTQIGLLPLPDTSITYNWIPTINLSSSDIPNPIANPATTTDYHLLMSNGICTDTIIQRVEVRILTVDAGNDTLICSGNITLHAHATVGANTFIWSSSPSFADTLNFPLSNSSVNINAITSGTYYVYASNQYCSKTDSVKVNVSLVSINAGNNKTICAGDTINLSVTNLNPSNPLSYSWTPPTYILSGANTATPLVDPPVTTSFIVTATDLTGCTKKDTVIVNVSAILPHTTIHNISCFGFHDGNASVHPTGGIGIYSYEWSNGSLVNHADSLDAGTYYVTITDGVPCEQVIQVIITEPPQLLIQNITTQNVDCDSICDGWATVFPTGGTIPYHYQWITGQTLQTADSLCAGSFQVIVTDTNGCIVQSIANITDTSNFNAQVDSLIPPLCYGDCNALAYASGIGGQLPYSYHWDSGDTLYFSDSYCAGTHHVIVVENAGCLRNIYFQVANPDSLFTVPGTVTPPSCYGFHDAQAQMGASGGSPQYSYLWDNGQDSSVAVGLGSGMYYVTVTDSHNCKTIDSVYIPETPLLKNTVTATNVPCAEICNSAALAQPSGGTFPYFFDWSNNTNLNPATELCSGIYTVTITDDHGCKLIDTVIVHDTVSFPPNIQTYADDTVIYNSQTTAIHTTIIPGYSYSWNPSQELASPHLPNSSASPSQTTTYYVTIQDAYGCVYVDSVTIFVIDVLCDESQVFVPNAFSPNGDNNNDVLYVRSNVVKDVYFVVYDRWGEKVFETYDMSKGWDGNFRGRSCDPAVYDYYLKTTCINDIEFIKKGNVTLIR